MIITARAILNQEDITKTIEQLQRMTDNKAVQKWIAKQVRKYLLNKYPNVVPVRKLIGDEPVWAKGAFERKELYKLNIKKQFINYFQEHIIHYLNTLTDKQLNGLQWDKAIKNTKKWERAIEKKGLTYFKGKLIDPETVRKYPNGWSWKELLEPLEIYQEGVLLSNCLKQEESGRAFAKQILSGKLRIFSLRDKYNKPHVSIGIERGTIIELKGKNNTQPEKYTKQILDFLNKPIKGLKIKEIDDEDCELFVKYKGNFYDKDTMIKLRPEPDKYINKRNLGQFQLISFTVHDAAPFIIQIDQPYDDWYSDTIYIVFDKNVPICSFSWNNITIELGYSVVDFSKKYPEEFTASIEYICNIQRPSIIIKQSDMELLNFGILKDGIFYTKRTIYDIVGESRLIEEVKSNNGTWYYLTEDKYELFQFFINQFKHSNSFVKEICNYNMPHIVLIKNNVIELPLIELNQLQKQSQKQLYELSSNYIDDLKILQDEFVSEYALDFGYYGLSDEGGNVTVPNTNDHVLTAIPPADTIYGNEISIILDKVSNTTNVPNITANTLLLNVSSYAFINALNKKDLNIETTIIKPRDVPNFDDYTTGLGEVLVDVYDYDDFEQLGSNLGLNADCEIKMRPNHNGIALFNCALSELEVKVIFEKLFAMDFKISKVHEEMGDNYLLKFDKEMLIKIKTFNALMRGGLL